MIYNKDFFWTGQPIQTDIGSAHFLKVKDYPHYYNSMQIFSMSKNELYYTFYKSNKNHEFDEILKIIKKNELYEIVISIPFVLKAYFDIFTKVFSDENVLEKINKNNFLEYRKLIMDMNCMKEKYVSSNPTIQKFLEKSERFKKQEHGEMTFSDIASTIVAFSGMSYEVLNEMTIFQFFLTFYRICQIKNYDTSTIFATVAGDTIKIDSFFKHINMFEDQNNYGLTKQEFNEMVKRANINK